MRRQRKANNLSQRQLAERIKTSQPRIAKIERADRDVSLDQILRAFAAAGGAIAIRQIERAHLAKDASKRGSGSSRKDQSQHALHAELRIDLIPTDR